jgi:uncharacterized protein
VIDEPLTDLGRFADALRAAGIASGVDRLFIAMKALVVMDEAGEADPYWPLRVAFCTRRTDVPIFDAVYRDWFGADETVEEVDARAGAEAQSDDATGAGGDDGNDHGDGESAAAGDGAELAQRDIERLSEAELEQIKGWVDLLTPVPRHRKAMRHRRARTGRVDATRTMRLLLANHGELAAVRYRRRVYRPRRLLLLVDVSRSMAPYSDVYLRFSHAALTAGPRTTEVFAVGTRWTRLTEQLRARDPADAMAAMADVETDWHGGTTLGPVFWDFLRSWGGRNTVRAAVVVLASDGFEFGDQTLLRQQVSRLSRLAGELIWVNPLRRTDDYVPLGRNLAQAQSYATVRLAGHNFDALRELSKVIGR